MKSVYWRTAQYACVQQGAASEAGQIADVGWFLELLDALNQAEPV